MHCRKYVPRVLGILTVTVSLSIFLGCGPSKKEQPIVRQQMVAKYTATPVVIDGRLDDEAWKHAAVYPLCIKKPDQDLGKALQEGGAAQLAWDNDNFYLAVTFTDSDIVAEGEKDQLHHYLLGDLVELFLKPEANTWYWELYCTPKGNKTSFFFPGRGRLWLDSATNYNCGLVVAANNNGTMNNWEDKDISWTAEMAMPIKDLCARGDIIAPGAKWLILVARYNYSRYIPWKEFSTAPQLPDLPGGYHMHEGYGQLVFEK